MSINSVYQPHQNQQPLTTEEISLKREELLADCEVAFFTGKGVKITKLMQRLKLLKNSWENQNKTERQETKREIHEIAKEIQYLKELPFSPPKDAGPFTLTTSATRKNRIEGLARILEGNEEVSASVAGPSGSSEPQDTQLQAPLKMPGD